MSVLISVVVLAASLQVISSDEPPPRCRGPPPGVERPHDCCKIPPFFEDKDFEECGFKKLDGDKEPSVKPHGPPDCTKQLCIMEKYGLIRDGEIDREAIATFLDQYTEKNPIFKPTVESVKARCLLKDLPGPPQVCEANKIVFCISSTLFSECPSWEKTDGCTLLKEHMEECKAYFKRQ